MDILYIDFDQRFHQKDNWEKLMPDEARESSGIKLLKLFNYRQSVEDTTVRDITTPELFVVMSIERVT